MNSSKIFWVHLKALTAYRVPHGKLWKILGGFIYHVTGTATALTVNDIPTGQPYHYIAGIESGSASGGYVINPRTVPTTYIEEYTGGIEQLLIPNEFQLYLTAAATGYVRLLIEEIECEVGLRRK